MAQTRLTLEIRREKVTLPTAEELQSIIDALNLEALAKRQTPPENIYAEAKKVVRYVNVFQIREFAVANTDDDESRGVEWH